MFTLLRSELELGRWELEVTSSLNIEEYECGTVFIPSVTAVSTSRGSARAKQFKPVAGACGSIDQSIDSSASMYSVDILVLCWFFHMFFCL